MTLNARFSQLRRNDGGRIGGRGGGVRRGGIVKRAATRGGTSKNRLLALQMANRPSVRAALNRGGVRGGRGGRGGFVPRGGYQQTYVQQNFRGNQRRGGGFNSTRAAVIAAIHQQTIPSFRVNIQRGRGQNYGNLNRGIQNRSQSFTNIRTGGFRQQPVQVQQVRIQRSPIQRVNARGAIQRVGAVQRGVGRGRRINRIPVQQRLGVVRQPTFTRGTGRVQRGRVQQQRGGRGAVRGRLQVQRGGARVQKTATLKTAVQKQQTVKRIAAGKIVKQGVRGKPAVAVKRGLIKRGLGAVKRGSRVLARRGAARAGSRVIQRGRPAQRGRAGTRLRGRGSTRGRGAVRVKTEAPSKESLDLDLEKYMANTKTFLDKDIDSYMMSQPQGTVSAINPITAPS